MQHRPPLGGRLLRKAFKREGHPVDHQKIHPGPSPAPDGHSVQHARPRSRRLLHCQQCSYVTLRKSHLVRHQRQHTGERPHPCGHCGKAFTQKTHLNAHLRIHTGECPFRCHLCPRAFTQGSSLASHLRSHAAGTSAR